MDEAIFDTDRRALAEELRRAFGDASGSAGPIELRRRLGREVLGLRFAGPTLVAPLTRAFAHLEPTDDAPTVTIDVWDSASTGRPLPFLVASLLRLLDRTWREDRDGRGQLHAYATGPVRAAYYGPRLLSVYDHDTRHGVFWTADHATLPWYEPGAPLRVLLEWALSGDGCELVHAGAIRTPAGAFLLGGAGGSGKSTTALSCIGHPDLAYLSDDYVQVDLTDAPAVRSVYCTAKVKSLVDLRRFPRLLGSVTNLERCRAEAVPAGGATDGDDGEKPMLFVHELDPTFVGREAPVRALVFPRYLALAEPSVAPLSPATAFKLLAPSTIQQMPGAGQDKLRSLRRLTQTVPAYGLGLPTDSTLIPAAVVRLAESLS